VSLLTKTETSIVMWLNSATIVARSIRLLPTHMPEDAHAACQNSMMVWSIPNAASVHQCYVPATDRLAAGRCPVSSGA